MAKGLYNGIGGKVELNTTPLETIIKKCQEELGVNISNWIELDSEISSSGIDCIFLTTLNEGEIKKATKAKQMKEQNYFL